MSRDYDLVLLGATGFTGGLTAEYLARRLDGTGRRWAIAGRNADKLKATRDRLARISDDASDIGIELADVHDLVSLLELTARTRVLATTVGPYIRFGELPVQACVRTATDYVDITGEPDFVNLLLRRYDGDARRQGVRVVNCCGFDSVPHDLGAQLAVQQLGSDAPIRLRGFVSAGGRPSGGTANSAIDAMASYGSERAPRRDPGAGRTVRSLPRRIERVDAIDGWALPFPTIDPQVVLRSAAALDEYGPDFRYGHFLRVGSLGKLVGVTTGVGAAAAMARFGPTRSLLRRLVPDRGDGPDEQARAKGWFRVTMLGEAGGREVRVEVRGGDPGYDETAKMLGESALCLLEDELPGRTGVITPATAMGNALRDRLRERGMAFDVTT